MSYIVIKTIGGRQYRYLQTSYRVGKKVKTKCVYLGRVRAIFTPIPPEQQGLRYIAKMMEKYPAPDANKVQSDLVKTVNERFTANTGLTLPTAPSNPTPVDKASAQEAPATENDSDATPDVS